MSSRRLQGCACALLLAGFAMPARAGILERTRLGNNAEGITFVDSGPLNNTVVIADGHQLRGINVGPIFTGVQELLDLKKLPLGAGIRGLAYVSKEKAFLLQEPSQPNTWFVLDRNAQMTGQTRTLVHLPSLTPNNGGEGLAYIPAGAPRYGDRIISCVYDQNFATHIEVLTRDGHAESEIIPTGSLAGMGDFAHVSFKAPNVLLVSTFDGFLWTMDLNGKTTGGPFGDGSPTNPLNDPEGIVATSNGTIVVAPYSDGKLLFFDGKFNRLPARDRDFKLGIGKSRPFGMAWDPDLDRLVLDVTAFFPAELISVPLSLNSFNHLASGSFRGVTYLPDEQRIAVEEGLGDEIELYTNDGVETEVIRLSVRSSFVTYVPTRRQFLVRSGDTALAVLDHSGALLGTLDYSSLGIFGGAGFGFFPARPGDPNPDGDLAVVDTVGRRIAVIDVDGTQLLGEISFQAIDLVEVLSVGYVTSGTQAGAFVAMDPSNSEVVVFRP